VQVRRRRPICAFELNDESAGEEKTPHTNWIVMRVTQVEIALEDWKKGIRGKGRENIGDFPTHALSSTLSPQLIYRPHYIPLIVFHNISNLGGNSQDGLISVW